MHSRLYELVVTISPAKPISLYALFNTENEAKSLFAARIGWKWSIKNMAYREKVWCKWDISDDGDESSYDMSLPIDHHFRDDLLDNGTSH